MGVLLVTKCFVANFMYYTTCSPKGRLAPVLKTILIKVSYHILVASPTLMALFFFFFFFFFVALRPMSTAMVIAGPSVHFTTLFPGQA